jgi:hypothetical protein
MEMDDNLLTFVQKPKLVSIIYPPKICHDLYTCVHDIQKTSPSDSKHNNTKTNNHKKKMK